MYYELPLTVDPPDKIYVCIGVPDERFHRMAFLGQIGALARWYSWQRDNARQGREVANVWKDIYYDVVEQMSIGGGCNPVNIQFRMNVCGQVEYSIDNGAIWLSVADMRDCFIWRNPDTANRNIIIPSGDWPNLDLWQRTGNTADLLRFSSNIGYPIGRINQQGYFGIGYYARYPLDVTRREGNVIANFEGGYPGYMQIIDDGSNNTGLLFHGGAYPNDHYLYLFAKSGGANYFMSSKPILITTGFYDANGYVKFDPTNEATVFGETTVTLTDTEVLFYPQSTTRRGSVSVARNTQSANLHENRTYNDVLLSAVDSKGRYVLSQTTGEPIDTPPDGTTAFDPSEPALWVKATSQWYKIGQQGPQGIQGIQGPIGPVGGPAWVSPRERPNAGENDECSFVVMADGYTVLPWLLEVGDVLVISAEGWWTDSIFNLVDAIGGPGYCPDGSQYTPASCFLSQGTTDPSDPLSNAYHMELCIAWKTASNTWGGGPCLRSALEVDEIYEIGNYAWLFANCPTLDGNSGGVTVTVLLSVPAIIGAWIRQFVAPACTWQNVGEMTEFAGDVTAVCGQNPYEVVFYFYEDDTYQNGTIAPCYVRNMTLTGFTDNGTSAYRDENGNLPNPYWPIPSETTPVTMVKLSSSTQFSYSFDIERV